MDDAARALGYLHASERLYQMEIQRRVGQGRIAEIVGPDLVGVDQFSARLASIALAESSFAALSPETQARLQAYADGVNAFLDTIRTRCRPNSCSLGDQSGAVEARRLAGLGQADGAGSWRSNTRSGGAARPYRGKSSGRTRRVAVSHAAKPDDRHHRRRARRRRHAELDDADDRLGALTGLRHGASNEWVVSGARTVTGKPILANDPHLGLGAPILWYLARIVTPEGSVKGATVARHADRAARPERPIAWGVTTADTDTQDLFVETIDPANPDRNI